MTYSLNENGIVSCVVVYTRLFWGFSLFLEDFNSVRKDVNY